MATEPYRFHYVGSRVNFPGVPASPGSQSSTSLQAKFARDEDGDKGRERERVWGSG